MINLLRRLAFELGTGRAVENARLEQHETAWTMAAIDALTQRLAPAGASDETIAA